MAEITWRLKLIKIKYKLHWAGLKVKNSQLKKQKTERHKLISRLEDLTVPRSLPVQYLMYTSICGT